MVINTNLQAQINADNLQATQARLNKSLARLSSGHKITSPSDDAAGLAVATQLQGQLNRTNAANSNVGNAISFLQTQDGYLSSVAKALNRMSELSILALDGTKTDSDRALYNDEYSQLCAYIQQAGDKLFNGISLFSGGTLDVTIDSEGSAISMNVVDLKAGAYAGATSTAVSSTVAASAALTAIKSAMSQLGSDRAMLGAYQARLNYSADQLTVSKENLMAANSRIMDVDVADESTLYAKENILVQSGTAMLAQANQLPQSVLRLLQ
jgi:flagellin